MKLIILPILFLSCWGYSQDKIEASHVSCFYCFYGGIDSTNFHTFKKFSSSTEKDVKEIYSSFINDKIDIDRPIGELRTRLKFYFDDLVKTIWMDFEGNYVLDGKTHKYKQDIMLKLIEVGIDICDWHNK